MKEFPIPKYDGYKLRVRDGGYEIIGKTGRPLSFSDNNSGRHLFCCACINGKPVNLYLHRAVALVYHHDSYFEGAQADHIDGNPRNNLPSNVRWVTGTITRKPSPSFEGWPCKYGHTQRYMKNGQRDRKSVV